MIVGADSIYHGDDLFPAHFVLHALMLPRFPYPLAASGSPGRAVPIKLGIGTLILFT